MTLQRQGTQWPTLPYDEWQATQATLHRWMQIVGKVTLEGTPFLNEWWNVGLTVTSRGMTTPLIPYGQEAFTIAFDFIDHTLSIDVTDGRTGRLPLRPQSVASFYLEFFNTLEALGIDMPINPMPVEIVDPVSLDFDEGNDAYDADAVYRWWCILFQTEKVLQRYRSSFAGKSSPVLFFWGSFDLAATRFSGHPASLPPGAPRFMQLAEDQENIAVGFWPGNDNYAGVPLGEPAFYAYIFPEPPGFKQATIRPAEAAYRPELGQFLLPYEAVRQAPAPEGMILDFFQSVYDAGSSLAGWDRPRLEMERVP